MTALLTLLIAAVACVSTLAWKPVSKGPKIFRSLSSVVYFKNTVVHSLIIATSASLIFYSPPEAFAGIDALDGALKAMTAGSDKEQQSIERDFNSLTSVASRKRYALSLCKEGSLYKVAGYSGAPECSSDVLNGNYQTIVDVSLGKTPVAAIAPKKESPVESPAVKAMPIMSKSQLAAVEAAKNPKPAAAVVEAKSSKKQEVASKKREKVEDLSDLSAAQKKRRSIAGCKKEETRKAAKMGSADKCTSRVMSGDLSPMIEALEYGY